MKKAKYLLVALLILSFALSAVSCYMISAQSMNKLKGTYKLTHYTYTPKYERKEGYSPKTIDYVNDEKYLYEDYLVITGSSVGYYVHKDANGNNYVKEISFTTNSGNVSGNNYVGGYAGRANGTHLRNLTNTVTVTGYDYSKHFVSPSTAEDRTAKKLVITFTGVTGTDITWGADGEPVKKPIAVKIVNGEYVVM